MFSGKGAQNKSTDNTWISRGIRKKIDARKRIFEREGQSVNWKRLKTRTTKIIKVAKIVYFNRIKNTAVENNDVKQYDKVIDLLKCCETPKKWDV